MKLKTRLAIFAVLLVIVAIAVCCTLIVSYAWNMTISGAVATAAEDMEGFYNTIAASCNHDMADEQIVQHSNILYIFKNTHGSKEYTLLRDGEYLSNNTGFAPENLLKSGYSVSKNESIIYKHLRINGHSYLILNRKITLGGDKYSLCLVRDVSKLSEDIAALAVNCIITGGTIIVITAFLMWFIVFKSLKPVEKLKASAAELAAGNYRNRIELKGKDELTELAVNFNSMADAIESNIKELENKSEQLREKSVRQQTFINDLTHEMKTPVTSILLNSEMLLNRRVTPEVLSNALLRIYDQGKWLERLSGKLMTLVMLQGNIELKKESVSLLIESVRESTDRILKEKNIQLMTECSADSFPMDNDLMRSALINLVENAKRASSEGQIITLTAHDNIIEVKDCGKGIPSEEIKRITDPFYMVDPSRSKQYGGSGLGMALVKKIADVHGAELIIKSKVNVGTTIQIVFPK